MRARFFGLRTGVTLIVLLAVLPAMAVILLSARDRRSDSEDRLKEQASQLSSAALVTYEHWIDATRTFLLPLANVFAIISNFDDLSDEVCAPVLDPLRESDKRFLFVGAADIDGLAICGSPPRGDTVLDVHEKPFFQRAVSTRTFAIGNVSIDGLSGRPTLHAGYPILGLDGSVRGVAYATLDLSALSTELGRPGPRGVSVMLVDEAGMVVANYPERDGIIGSPVGSANGSEEEGVVTRQDGERVMFARETEEAPAIGAVGLTTAYTGVPTDEAFAAGDARLRNDLLALSAVGVLAVSVAWLGSTFLLRDLRRYVETTRKLESGDLSARVGPPYPETEIGTLGRAFDEMAAALDERAAEVRQLNEDLERRVQARTLELERANAELESFSYSVSHDLRAPLRAIDGYTRIILDEHAETLDPEAQRYFEATRTNAKRMGQLIDDLLTFSRLGRRPLARAPVSLEEIAREVGGELMRGREPPVRFVVGTLPECECDAALMRQVLANLIGNAVKFTSKREDPNVTVGFDETQRAYFVRDNGVGFDMQYAGKMFGVFQRLHRDEDFEGTGVGLAIVQRVINRHGGRIWAESEQGVETTFYFTIGEGDGLGD